MVRHKKHYRVKNGAAVIYLLLALFIGFGWGVCHVTPYVSEYMTVHDLVPIHSQTAFLVDDDGKTRYAQREDERIYPASLTKLLTAWTVVQHCDDLDELITVEGDILVQLVGKGASTAGLRPGETLSMRELLTALLQPSGADAALQLAHVISGSETAFVQLMNEQAQALGMTSSHFANVSGLDDEAHYSTAKDLMRLWRAVLDNAALREIVTVSQDNGRFQSTLLNYEEGLTFAGGRILGGKTGYTTKAGQCLASFAEIDGKWYYLVTTGAPGESSGRGYHLADAQLLYEYCTKK